MAPARGVDKSELEMPCPRVLLIIAEITFSLFPMFESNIGNKNFTSIRYSKDDERARLSNWSRVK